MISRVMGVKSGTLKKSLKMRKSKKTVAKKPEAQILADLIEIVTHRDHLKITQSSNAGRTIDEVVFIQQMIEKLDKIQKLAMEEKSLDFQQMVHDILTDIIEDIRAALDTIQFRTVKIWQEPLDFVDAARHSLVLLKGHTSQLRSPLDFDTVDRIGFAVAEIPTSQVRMGDEKKAVS